jgi:hypothetical protein
MSPRLSTLLVLVLAGASCGGRKRPKAPDGPPPSAASPAPSAPGSPTQSLPMEHTAAPAAAVFGAIRDIIDQGHSEADGRVCDTDTVTSGCKLVYRTSCHRPGAPEGLAFWYEITVPLGKLDIDQLRSGLGLSDHPGHQAVELVTQGEVMDVVTDSDDKSTAASGFIAIGADPEAASRAERLVTLLKQAAIACRQAP